MKQSKSFTLRKLNNTVYLFGRLIFDAKIQKKIRIIKQMLFFFERLSEHQKQPFCLSSYKSNN